MPSLSQAKVVRPYTVKKAMQSLGAGRGEQLYASAMPTRASWIHQLMKYTGNNQDPGLGIVSDEDLTDYMIQHMISGMHHANLPEGLTSSMHAARASASHIVKLRQAAALMKALESLGCKRITGAP